MTTAELTSLLRDAEAALWSVVNGDTSTAQRTQRELARALRELDLGTPDGVCPCGKPLVQQGIGRPKAYCNPTCRKREQRKRQAPKTSKDVVLYHA